MLKEQHGYDIVILFHSGKSNRHIFDCYATSGAARSFVGDGKKNPSKYGDIILRSFQKFMGGEFNIMMHTKYDCPFRICTFMLLSSCKANTKVFVLFIITDVFLFMVCSTEDYSFKSLHRTVVVDAKSGILLIARHLICFVCYI